MNAKQDSVTKPRSEKCISISFIQEPTAAFDLVIGFSKNTTRSSNCGNRRLGRLAGC